MSFDDDKLLEDSQIIKKISNWDIDMFSIIVDRYEQKLLKYIMKISNVDITEAENLLQEVFIKVFKNINWYKENYKFSAWIYKITFNHVWDNYRKEKNKKEISLDENINSDNNESEEISLLELLEDQSQNIVKNIEQKELSKLIKNAIKKLDEKYKNVIILKYYENLSYDEISDILETPYNTVWTLMNRAKKQLKEILEKENINLYL